MGKRLRSGDDSARADCRSPLRGAAGRNGRVSASAPRFSEDEDDEEPLGGFPGGNQNFSPAVSASPWTSTSTELLAYSPDSRSLVTTL
jgi:hypothetical protein